jgi:hypothetical protein
MKNGRSTARVLQIRMIALCIASLGTACTEDPIGPPATQGDAVGIVLASTDRALTIFPVESPGDASSVGLAPDGSPVTLAARGGLAAVPMGTVPAVVIVNLTTRAVARTIPLPEGSGATGIAFLNDSIAIVGNPGRNTVSPVNVRRGTAGPEIVVGTYPHAAVSVADTVFVLNANLGPDFQPAGPSTVSVIAGSPAGVVRTITLTGSNAGAAVATTGGQLVVVHAGEFGAANGSISVVNRATLTESRHVTGFGDFPGSITVSSTGRVHVGSFSYGLAVWDPATDTFVHAPDDAIEPGGLPSVAGLGFDDDDRLYTLVPDCRAPSSVLRLTAAYDVDTAIPTGICPFAIVFARVP